ncbi:MAG TPA: DNA-binding domain-containing protein [Anaeromyxobacter sp.]|nr:DNA-binding domain-containing protein [Anaeromyxobacter sp.]
MTLAETQALFHAAITGGEVSPAALEACFAGTPALPAADRVGIYAEMWLWRQVEALGAEFPAVRACVGGERFPELCRDYLRAHPSEHHDIGRLGRRLAEFLRLHPAPERSDLGDLAELEWARSEVFCEAPASPVGREALAALGPEEFARARLRLVPALRLLSLAHRAQEPWRAAHRGEEPTPAAPGPAYLAVWRAGHDVLHAPLDAAEARALEAALAGAALSEVCASFAAADQPATVGFAALSSWLDEGWVAGVEVVEDPNRPAGAHGALAPIEV